MTTSAWANWTDEQLIEHARMQARAQERVTSMPRKERTAVGKKGEVSPEQGVALNLWFLVMAVDELQRRGVDTDAINV